MNRLIGLLTIVLMTACAATKSTALLTPEAENVWVTQDSKQVAGCKSLGVVETTADDEEVSHVLRNKTALLGGNLLFITNRNGGVAYLCPDPVATGVKP